MRRQADLLVDLVNLAIPGHCRGYPYPPPAESAVLREFVTRLSESYAGSLASSPTAAADLTDLARQLHAALSASDITGTAAQINTTLAQCRALPYLTDDTDQPFHLHFHGTGGPVQALGGELATALALVIDTVGQDRFGLCQANACDRTYIDLTRNGSRRYCSNACASRAKTAAFRTRQAAQPR